MYGGVLVGPWGVVNGEWRVGYIQVLSSYSQLRLKLNGLLKRERLPTSDSRLPTTN